VQLALWSGLAVVLVISALTDLRSRRIPDVVTYPAFVLALAGRALFEGVGNLESGLLSGLLMGLLAFAAFALFAWRGKMGWGDAKLMGVVGAVFGFPMALEAVLLISVCGAALALVAVLRKGVRHIPYALPIALGCFWAMWRQHSTMLQ
jgi:prepilin peptidase CpaA